MRHSRSDPSFRALVAEAVRIVGSQSALAARLGCSQQLISFLCTRATEISAEDAVGIHRATGGKVSDRCCARIYGDVRKTCPSRSTRLIEAGRFTYEISCTGLDKALYRPGAFVFDIAGVKHGIQQRTHGRDP